MSFASTVTALPLRGISGFLFGFAVRNDKMYLGAHEFCSATN